MDAAGVQPGADLPQERLEAMRDLAEATVTADLVAGRIRGVQAMTVAGIARRHIAKPPPPPDPDTAAQQDLDRMIRELDPDEMHDLSLVLIALIHVDEDEDISDPVAYVNALIDQHGSLEAWREWQRADHSRRLDAQLERNRLVRDAAVASARQAMLDNQAPSISSATEAHPRESDDG